MALSFGLGSALLLLPSSRKRAVSSTAAAAAAAAAAAPPQKRARRRGTTSDTNQASDTAIRTPPPSLLSSSSSSSSSSSHSSLDHSTTCESSSVVDDVNNENATEGGRRRRHLVGDRGGGGGGGGDDAMSAARARLRSARLCASHSLESLRRARSEYGRTMEEARRAEECLRSMERRWEVVDVDVDVDADADADADAHGGEEDNSSASSRSSPLSSLSEFENEGVPRIVRVGRAGDVIVNGTYRLLLPHSALATTLECRRSRSMPTGPIYVHEDGPFDVQGDLHEVCIFRREGYGDKARWCIGLVPRRRADCANRSNNDDVDDAEDDVEWRRRQCDRGGCGGWDFALAYIYYWMEVDANEIDAASLLANRDGEGASSSFTSSSSWGICHGARPLPTLEDMSDGGTMARWWKFWKHG